ncbi:hypothetical protein LTR86_000187 [Recurvomyces mirabilis]|nr:hypothetical protein LTR86_000187 [Recurvomyces mirabilis]
MDSRRRSTDLPASHDGYVGHGVDAAGEVSLSWSSRGRDGFRYSLPEVLRYEDQFEGRPNAVGPPLQSGHGNRAEVGSDIARKRKVDELEAELELDNFDGESSGVDEGEIVESTSDREIPDHRPFAFMGKKRLKRFRRHVDQELQARHDDLMVKFIRDKEGRADNDECTVFVEHRGFRIVDIYEEATGEKVYYCDGSSIPYTNKIGATTHYGGSAIARKIWVDGREKWQVRVFALGEAVSQGAEDYALEKCLAMACEDLEENDGTVTAVRARTDSVAAINNVRDAAYGLAPSRDSALRAIASIVQLNAKNVNVTLSWVKGHRVCEGNFIADKVASWGAKQSKASVAAHTVQEGPHDGSLGWPFPTHRLLEIVGKVYEKGFLEYANDRAKEEARRAEEAKAAAAAAASAARPKQNSKQSAGELPAESRAALAEEPAEEKKKRTRGARGNGRGRAGGKGGQKLKSTQPASFRGLRGNSNDQYDEDEDEAGVGGQPHGRHPGESQGSDEWLYEERKNNNQAMVKFGNDSLGKTPFCFW